MHRFFIDSNNVWEKLFIVNDIWLLNQIKKVLRFKLQDNLIIFNGKKNIDFVYKITKIDKKQINLELNSFIEKNTEIKFELNLYSALPNKIEKIEYIIQKASEIGFSNFYFFRSDRSQKIIINDNKIDRLRKIIVEAIEQSNRNKVPNINIIENINIKNISWYNLFFHTINNNAKNIENINYKEDIINIFVWPEWWWSDNEIEKFKENNFVQIFLWNRIFRTETVGSVVWYYIISKKSS